MEGLPWFISIIIILVLFSSFFSASETAYTSINKIRLKTESDDGDKRAQAVLDISEKYDILISTILIGNNIVNIASATLATIVFTFYFAENGSWISTLIMTLVVLIFGEIVPKGFAKAHAEEFAKIVYPIIKFLIAIFLPLSWCFKHLTEFINNISKTKSDGDDITEDDLLTIIDEIEEEGKIKPYEKELISSAVKFDDIEVKDIVTPRKNITAISKDMTLSEIHDVFEDSKFTRIPVYDETIDNIIGVLREKDFYNYLVKSNDEPFEIKKIMKRIPYVHQDIKISVLFKMFKDKHEHMAIVLDQFDSTLGLVTLEDVIEELVGEIFDETDEIFEETKQIDEDHYKVSGKEILEDAFNIIGIEIDEDDDIDLNQTVNSWLSSTLSAMPTSGDNFIFKDEWKVMVTSANRKGAKEVVFERL